jgi:hypothetical protein
MKPYVKKKTIFRHTTPIIQQQQVINIITLILSSWNIEAKLSDEPSGVTIPSEISQKKITNRQPWRANKPHVCQQITHIALIKQSMMIDNTRTTYTRHQQNVSSRA